MPEKNPLLSSVLKKINKSWASFENGMLEKMAHSTDIDKNALNILIFTVLIMYDISRTIHVFKSKSRSSFASVHIHESKSVEQYESTASGPLVQVCPGRSESVDTPIYLPKT